MTLAVRFQITKGDFVLDAEFSVPAVGITALLGPSGCGKTTLLRAIAGLETDSCGYCQVGEVVWQRGSESLPTHRRELGYVFQEASLFAHLTVQANLEYGLKRVAPSQRRIPMSEAISLLGVEPLLARHTSSLSGGERQRVAIARALLSSPKLLLMDEPLAALDQQSKQEILPYLEQLHRALDIPVLYVSHSQDEVARLADHLILMDNGRVLASGPIANMLTRIDLPLAQADDAEVLIEAKVCGRDDAYQLTRLQFSGGELTVACKSFPIGHRVRVRLLSRDVSVSLQPPRQTSILNSLPAKVMAVAELNPAQVMVHLQLGSVTVLSRITRKSAAVLAIEPGMMVYAQIKTVALLA